jgi:hypothetical protein
MKAREQPTVSQIFKGTFLKVDYPGTPFNQLLGQNDFGQVPPITAQRWTMGAMLGVSGSES